MPRASASVASVPRWWTSPRLLVLLFVLSLPAVTPRIYASDEVQYFSYLRSIWFDHDVSFENEYQHFYDAGIARRPGFTRRSSSARPKPAAASTSARSDAALLWAPFYADCRCG